MTKALKSVALVAGLILGLTGAAPVLAQNDPAAPAIPEAKPDPVTAAATRFPAQGMAILDCSPATPAPADSCILRVPLDHQLEKIVKSETGTASGAFSIQRDLAAIAPDLRLSATLVLIDLTPGLGRERKPTWPRERALIAEFLRNFPEGEPVALYGFNESLDQISDFTTDHADLARRVEALELRGTNTRIATSTRSAIDLLAARKNTILRNIVVISDGEEEGNLPISEVTQAAIRNGVTISSLGIFWRNTGLPQNGAGMDYLQKISDGTLGITVAAQIGREADARVKIAGFNAALARAYGDSGLITPTGAAVEADITVHLRKPRAGEAGVFDPVIATANFKPAALRGKPAKPPPEPEPEPEPAEVLAWYQGEWAGYPVLWWLIGAGALGLALVLLLVILSRRPAPADDELPQAGFGDLPPEPMPVVNLRPAPPPTPALAWLVRSDTGERLPVSKARVTIGRAATCDVVLADGSVSRLHAELEQQARDEFALSDCGSLNKTRVNGREIKKPCALKPGDTISLGDLTLRFTLA